LSKFHELGSLTCSVSELTSSIINTFIHFVGIFGRGIDQSQGFYLNRQRNTHTHKKNADIHPCLKRNSNPQSQCSSGPSPYAILTAWPLGQEETAFHMLKKIIILGSVEKFSFIMSTQVGVDVIPVVPRYM
jgi:hypothetical protein